MLENKKLHFVVNNFVKKIKLLLNKCIIYYKNLLNSNQLYLIFLNIYLLVTSRIYLELRVTTSVNIRYKYAFLSDVFIDDILMLTLKQMTILIST